MWPLHAHEILVSSIHPNTSMEPANKRPFLKENDDMGNKKVVDTHLVALVWYLHFQTQVDVEKTGG